MIEQNMDTHQRSTEQRVSTFFPVELEKSEVLAVVDAIIARLENSAKGPRKNKFTNSQE